MKWRIIKNARWFFWARGMVFFRWVILKDDDPRLYRHELEHCYQQYRIGSKWKFYWRYLKFGFTEGWGDYKHPYEIEAEARENDRLTPQELVWLSRGKIRM